MRIGGNGMNQLEYPGWWGHRRRHDAGVFSSNVRGKGNPERSLVLMFESNDCRAGVL